MSIRSGAQVLARLMGFKKDLSYQGSCGGGYERGLKYHRHGLVSLTQSRQEDVCTPQDDALSAAPNEWCLAIDGRCSPPDAWLVLGQSHERGCRRITALNSP